MLDKVKYLTEILIFKTGSMFEKWVVLIKNGVSTRSQRQPIFNIK